METEAIEELKEYLQNLPDQISHTDIAQAKRDFYYFTREYLLHHIEFTKKETSYFRKVIYKDLPTLAKKNSFLIFTAYRGAAKTTILSAFFTMFEAARAARRYIIIISSTQTLSNGILELIRVEFAENKKLKNDLHIKVVRDKTESIVISVDGFLIKISCFGAGAKIRGTKFLSFRPDLIIVDDLEDDELVLNKAYRNKQTNWFKKVVLKLPSRTQKEANIIMVGTMLHHDSVLKRLIELADFYQNFPLVLDFKTWKLDNPKLDKAQLKKEYADDKEGFLQEYQNIPLSKDALTFSHYQTYETMPKCSIYSIAIDPSMGKANGDYFAIAVMGWDKKNKKLYLDAKGYKKNPTDMIYTILQTYIRYSKIARCILSIETVAYQEFFKDVFKRQAKDTGLLISIKEFRNNIPKVLRINSLAPLITDATILVYKKAHLLRDELDTYPKSAHDDLIDASEMAKRALDIGGGVDYEMVRNRQREFKALKRFKIS